MNEVLFDVEVVYANMDRQLIISSKVAAGCSVRQVIVESGVLLQCSEIDLKSNAVGIFSKVCQLDDIVVAGDRVEIYRPLLQNPMDARRDRAKK